MGRSVVVLLSRRDPGFAELPGHPVDNYGDFAVAYVIGAVIGLIAASFYLLGGWQLKLLRQELAADPAESTV